MVKKILKKIYNMLKPVPHLDRFRTLKAKKFYRNIVVFKGGNFYIAGKNCISGKAQLRLNASNYENRKYIRPGVLRIFNGGKLILGDNENSFSTIFSGGKIDVFSEGILSIGNKTYINDYCRIGAKKSISIGSNCMIGDSVSIHDFDGHKINGKEGIAEITIEDNVWIGENVTILKGVRIGKGAIIGAGSLVCKDIPSGCIAAGSPAKVIKENAVWEP